MTPRDRISGWRRRLPGHCAGDRLWRLLIPVSFVLVALARIPRLAWRLGPDEGGFLVVAHQWGPGTSLYGDYWVDRPPLLITLFRLADLAGGTVGLRLLGLVAVLAAMLAASRLGAHLAGAQGAGIAAAVVAVFGSTPLFGTREVNGELLALPFVMAGILLVVTATRSRAWIAAGACAVAAAAVKQNVMDVLVAAVVVLAWRAWTKRPWRRELVLFVLGVVVTAAVVLIWAALHGTGLVGLWDAVVTFRAEAAGVIHESASSATPRRAHLLLQAFLSSGAVLVVAIGLVPLSRRLTVSEPPSAYVDLRLLAVPVVAWETFGVVAGGSYWLHYLIGLIPGLVLIALAVAQRRPRLLPLMALALAWAVFTGASSWHATTHVRDGDMAVEQWLRTQSRPGDTAVIAYGDPALLRDTRLSSPYQYLWSLQVRTRDADLAEFARVLRGPRAPRWVVVAPDGLGSWGIDARAAEPVLRSRYRDLGSFGKWTVFERAPAGVGPGGP